MKKQEQKKQKTLVLERESLHKLQDDVLSSVAGGCSSMPITCGDITNV